MTGSYVEKILDFSLFKVDNSLIHCFFRPLIVIGGSSEQHQEGMGAFQEYPQVLSTFGGVVFFPDSCISIIIIFYIVHCCSIIRLNCADPIVSTVPVPVKSRGFPSILKRYNTDVHQDNLKVKSTMFFCFFFLMNNQLR